MYDKIMYYCMTLFPSEYNHYIFTLIKSSDHLINIKYHIHCSLDIPYKTVTMKNDFI